MSLINTTLGYLVVGVAYTFTLFTAIPEPFSQYIVSNNLGILAFFTISTLTMVGLKAIIGFVITFLKIKNYEKYHAHMKIFRLNISICTAMGITLPVLIYHAIPEQHLADISNNYYNQILYFVLTFLVVQGAIDILRTKKSRI